MCAVRLIQNVYNGRTTNLVRVKSSYAAIRLFKVGLKRRLVY